MNEVFALMWLGDVVGSISFIGGAALAGIIIGAVFFSIACGVYAATEEEDVMPKWLAGIKSLITWLCVPVILATVMPGKQTIHLMAAAKAGEQLMATKTGGKAIEALNAVLDKIVSTAKKQ